MLLVALVASPVLADPAKKPDKADKPAETKTTPPKQDEYELLKVLVDALDQIDRNYVKEIDRRELLEAAVHGMLSRLDPYSTYISPADAGDFRTSVEKEFGGIGIQLDDESGPLRVLSPLVGTPAYRGGVLAGDRIVAIDDQSTDGMRRDEAVRRLKGLPGTQVTITVIHMGSTEREKIVIEREVIRVDTVMGYRRQGNDAWDFMFDPAKHIGYIRLTAFSRDTARDLRKSLEELKQAHMRGLVLDLRFNPGGLLPSAIEVSRLFVSQGRIVSTAGRNSPERVWDSHSSDAFEGFPMVVLVNRFSASASEIVAACLQDHHRALIVGQRTWGKGRVQNVIELDGNQGILKLTTANYLRPSGRNIDRDGEWKEEGDEWGVMPDPGYALKLGDQEMTDLIRDRRDRDVVRPHTENASATGQSLPAVKTSEKKTVQQDAGPAKKVEKKGTAAKSDSGKPSKGGDESAQPSLPADPASLKPSTPADNQDAKSKAADKPKKFVDRQLQMAVDYLTAELARVEQP
jgi:carboxyl-terminal processing protease